MPKREMSYYEDLAEMYVGTDVSPEFLWVGSFLNMIMLLWVQEPCKESVILKDFKRCKE